MLVDGAEELLRQLGVTLLSRLTAGGDRPVRLFYGFDELLGCLVDALLFLFIHNAQATFSVWLSQN